jgi:hypothetical protein
VLFGKLRPYLCKAAQAPFDGFQVLVKEVRLFSPEFDEKVEALATDDAKASEMEHAIRHEINVRVEENPVFYRSLRERLEEIIEQRRQEQLDAAQQLKLFSDLREELQGEQSQAEDMALDARGFAIYGLLEKQRPRKVAATAMAPSASTGASSRPRCAWSTTSSSTSWCTCGTAVTAATTGRLLEGSCRTTSGAGRTCGAGAPPGLGSLSSDPTAVRCAASRQRAAVPVRIRNRWVTWPRPLK